VTINAGGQFNAGTGNNESATISGNFTNQGTANFGRFRYHCWSLFTSNFFA
jgi:hypothetical protein